MDDNGLPPLPTPSDTVSSDTTVTPVAQIAPPLVEPEKPKKKSNMKVVVGMVVALFLVGASIAVPVLFPGFRGDLRQRASYGDSGTCTSCLGSVCVAWEGEYPGNGSCTSGGGGGEGPVTGTCDSCVNGVCVAWSPPGSSHPGNGSCTSGGGGGEGPDYQVTAQPTQEIPYEEVHDTPAPTSTEDNNYSGGSSGNNNSGGGTGGGTDACEVMRQCPDGSTRSVCDSCPSVATTTTTTNECSGTTTQCVGGYTQRCSNGEWYDTQQRCCTQDPVLCSDGTEVNGCWEVCPTGQTGTVTGAPGIGGSSNGGVKECVPNQCHRRSFGKRDGSMCDANGNNTGVWCDMGDTGEGTGEINTCGCVDGEVAGQSGPYVCWVKNGATGAFIRQLGVTITKSGCKGSGTPSVTTSVTASVTTTPGGSTSSSSSSSSGGSSSSSSGGSSSSSSGGVSPMCVETRVYLKKADGTFETTVTPVAQLSSKLALGSVIRLAVRGNLANFTKARFVIKNNGAVLETKETTTKNNLPGDAATFEYTYDYTITVAGSYTIEGSVWQ